MRESTQLLELRGRMAAWDRSFFEGHGRHPTEFEWASAARVVGRLPVDEAERLARATYSVYGDDAASAPSRDDFSAFAEELVARQERRRAAYEQATESQAFRRAAAPFVVAGLAIAAWAANRRRGKLAA